MADTVDSMASPPPMMPLGHSSCHSCVRAQLPTAQYEGRRTRRSNSCPSGKRSFAVHQLTSQSNNHRAGITKRWHSISALYVKETDRESPVCTRTDNVHSNNTLTSRLACDTGISSIGRSPTSSLTQRAASLFTFGASLALLLNFLQKQKRVTVFSPGLFGDVLNSAWWIPPTFGLGASVGFVFVVVIGLLYPKMDQLAGNQKSLNQEWSSVMRCIAMFVGINHASARIDFDSNIHLSLTLGMLSLGLWYFFDQSLCGLWLGLTTTGIATTVTQVLVAMDVFGYSNPDFLYMQSWVPCLYFSGGVTIGAFGRALATLEDPKVGHSHTE